MVISPGKLIILCYLLFIYSFLFPFLIITALLSDQVIDIILINGLLISNINYSLFNCLYFNSINSFSFLFIISYLLLISIILFYFNSIQFISSSIIGSLTTYYLPLVSDILIIISNSLFNTPINIIEVISFNYSLFYLLLINNSILINSFIFILLLIILYYLFVVYYLLLIIYYYLY